MFSTLRKCHYDAENKIFRGPRVPPTFGTECSIGGEALKSLMKDPEHISQICYTNGKQYTNRDIATLSIRVAQHFRDHLKVPQCEVIGLCVSNSEYVAPLYFGGLLAGLIHSTLDPSFEKDGIKHIYSVTRPTMMFCDGNNYAKVKEALDEINLKVKIYTMNNHIDGVPQITEFLRETGTEKSFVADPLKDGWNQTAMIACSSGTTGLPKGVCLSHASLLNQNVGELGVDSFLSFSTLYWVSGIYSLVVCTILNVTRIISERGFSTHDFFDIMAKYRVQGLLTPPSQLALILADKSLPSRDLSCLKLYVCGGSAVSYALVQKMLPFIRNAKFWVGYGMTELSGICSSCQPMEEGCVGVISNNVQVKILDDDGNHLGPNERGEICIKADYPWSGYYDNAEATAATYINGWVHSGDIGYFNDANYLFVVDRKKEILKYNNFHFAPSEIESIIYDINGVAEVAVCGIPDLVASFLPAAAIVKAAGSKLTERQVIEHVARNAPAFKHLHGGVYFFEALPKTVSGKAIRKKITEICTEFRNRNLNKVSR